MRRIILITILVIVIAAPIIYLSLKPMFEEPEVPTASAPIPKTIDTGLDATINSISLSKDKYYVGDTVVAELKVKNTGEVDISSETIEIRATCNKLDDFGGNLALKAMSEEDRSRISTLRFSETINPGQTKALSASFYTPEEMQGISLAGEYDIFIKLKANKKVVDSEKLTLTLLAPPSS
ncbi:MAG: hypothetical protein SVM80_04405 [Halobacteriota archaeon]|nr:hypothetical protein [Halobacteriota archaeon]